MCWRVGRVPRCVTLLGKLWHLQLDSKLALCSVYWGCEYATREFETGEGDEFASSWQFLMSPGVVSKAALPFMPRAMIQMKPR